MGSFIYGGPVLWPVPPDWSTPVRETLSWNTDYLSARNGARQKRQLRLAPRRSFEFKVLAGAAEHRLLDVIRFDQGTRQWLLPIWPDGQFQRANLPPGSLAIPCSTAGRDFVAGGSAVLWSAINQWEVVSVDAIADNSIALTAPTLDTWPAGSRLYPARLARTPAALEATYRTDDATTLTVTMQVDEPCDHAALAPTAVYRGFPVLEWRHDETSDPTAKYDRPIQQIDGETGLVTYMDLPGRSFRLQSHNWNLHGLDERMAFRKLLYWLRGRMGTLWVPSYAADLVLASDAASGAISLVVAWCGYTVFGRQQSNRKDIRLELLDGTVMYRRITHSAEGVGVETLTIDAPLSTAVVARMVRAISFMTLSEQATDTVTIDHLTDIEGVAHATTNWAGIRHDV